jgi:hypothetical protein
MIQNAQDKRVHFATLSGLMFPMRNINGILKLLLRETRSNNIGRSCYDVGGFTPEAWVR